VPRFRYKAAEPNGDTAEGEIEAANEAAVVASLRAGDRLPIRIVPIASAGPRNDFLQRLGAVLARPLFAAAAIAPRDLAGFAAEAAALLNAGLALDRVLGVIAAAAATPAVKVLATRLAERLRRGQTFSAALEAEGAALPSLIVALARAGEAGGALPRVLEQYAAYANRAEEVKESVRSALTYPLIVLAAAAASVGLLLVFVVPEFELLFRESGRPLPLETRLVMGMAGLVREYGWLLLAVSVTAAVGFAAALEEPAFAARVHRAWLKAPLFGPLALRFEVERFARGLALLVGGGTPLAAALPLATEAVKNRALAAAFAAVATRVREGASFAAAVRAEPLLPIRLVELASIADETGRIDAVMERTADLFRHDVARTLKRMTALLEPVLVLVLGAIVAVLVVSILSAIVGFNALAT
jgi:general secretion pathway protein F